MPKKKSTPVTIDSIRHNERRANIPTEELRGFVREDEHAPGKLLYPRDPSLDPQLVWKGKDEQDREDLAVPVVPIYIQEKIHPQAIIEALPRKAAPGDEQPELFADFNGLEDDFSRKVDFYSHDVGSQPHWSNRMILGDSMLVMASLAEKEGLKGKVQTIYLDPPYGIKFGSNWQVSTRKRDVKDGKATDATRQPEQVRAFRDTWKLGIHSYLAYLRDRLTVARDLLTETGSIFVQIGDENVHLVRCVMDEVFGSENFVSLITVSKTGSLTGELLSSVSDYLVWYGRDKSQTKYRKLFDERAERDSDNFSADPLKSDGFRTGTTFDYVFQDQTFECKQTEHWKVTREGLDRLALAGRLVPLRRSLRMKRFWEDFPVKEYTNIWHGLGGASDIVYVVQTNRRVIERCLLMTTDPGDLVLDPTCGSGTTAYVAEQWGRRWITIDTSRVALALARTRLMAAKYPYYLLADSPEGIQKEAELTGRMVGTVCPPGADKQWHEADKQWHGVNDAGADRRRHCPARRHRDTVRPALRGQQARAGVRPLHRREPEPHRTISFEEKKELSENGRDGWKTQVVGPDDFGTMILENLRKAGVQNTRKDERLKFDTLEPYAGEWIQGQGTYTEADGRPKRAAICIGPEHGTVGAALIKEAAKEAVKGVGFDLLIVCGFAFDPSVSEEAKRYGKLTVLPAKMNPDLAMGDELLKKTGAGNLFMVFGEPDVEIRTVSVPLLDQGQAVAQHIEVEIKGLDVYDPTTGQIRNSTTDDIACWFIDTAYNGESFFVRHAYFTGADEPYKKLRRALRAEIDEAAWSSLYSTVSRPFPRPDTGKIAVKVINHYGDEIMKVFSV